MRISDWSSDVCSSDLDLVEGLDVSGAQEMIRILQAHDHRDLAVALGAQDIGELVDAREDMAVARDEIAPDRKEAERLLLRGGAAEADRVMDGGDAARTEVRGLLFAQRLGVIFKSDEHTSELQSIMR